VDRFLREEQSGISQEFAVQTLFLPKLESDSTAQTSARRSQATVLLGNAKAAQTPEAFAGLQNTVVDAIGKHQVNTPFRTLDKFPEIFSAAIENMAVGAVSPLLESSAGFYVLRLANKRTVLPQVSQTKARHILLRVEGDNPEVDDAARQTIKKLHDRLTLNIDLFPAIAKEFSQDGSAAKGGDLGWALPGDMVTEFERVMDVLKEGEMALPLRSQFGWHIVQVLERKAGDLPKERLRAQARNVLRTRKQDEALGEWLEQLKAQAYIEYKR
jgi:peptidyl-prolyl cis-trans isomerase SurA